VYSAVILVQIPMPTSMPSLTRNEGSASRRSRNPARVCRGRQRPGGIKPSWRRWQRWARVFWCADRPSSADCKAPPLASHHPNRQTPALANPRRSPRTRDVHEPPDDKLGLQVQVPLQQHGADLAGGDRRRKVGRKAAGAAVEGCQLRRHCDGVGFGLWWLVLGWVVLGWVVVGWVGLCCVGLCWVGLCWVGLWWGVVVGWVVVGGFGLGWVGIDRGGFSTGWESERRGWCKKCKFSPKGRQNALASLPLPTPAAPARLPLEAALSRARPVRRRACCCCRRWWGCCRCCVGPGSVWTRYGCEAQTAAVS